MAADTDQIQSSVSHNFGSRKFARTHFFPSAALFIAMRLNVFRSAAEILLGKSKLFTYVQQYTIRIFSRDIAFDNFP